MAYNHKDIDVNRLNLTDIDIYQCGQEKCKPGHSYGPAVRDHYLIHFIYNGRGIFQVGENTYHLEAGQGFLICPDIVTYYQADRHNPWEYAWIGFHGLKAKDYLNRANLSLANPVFSDTDGSPLRFIFEEMTAARKLKRSREIKLIGLIYVFLSHLIELNVSGSTPDNNSKENYIKKAIEYIEKNYSRHIKVIDIANHVGLDRSYLWSIFNEFLNTSPQQYLINYRINKACELMKNRNLNLSIGDISRSVGYKDPLTFSKTFKKTKGISPLHYQKQS
ncbi:AraC family transcriptional regulator [Halothermothrix orenii]|uniref:Transcriptional regulator, AraC family n=1 Tax=Halothermothrix orenii (strain H 168 / OCM 544 / DSM 9562) TaxID=373903 RepID=B8D1C2_HALOH|nr:AraC family transcriptional regulator [Halothermothrix orenii]ACL71074.1 transcriptional regulator, AraC family [Halothermothrix orenii H 168]